MNNSLDFNYVMNFQGNHPNTYTYTKNLAETIVLQNVSKLPVCIVRPSIGMFL